MQMGKYDRLIVITDVYQQNPRLINQNVALKLHTSILHKKKLV